MFVVVVCLFVFCVLNQPVDTLVYIEYFMSLNENTVYISVLSKVNFAPPQYKEQVSFSPLIIKQKNCCKNNIALLYPLLLKFE